MTLNLTSRFTGELNPSIFFSKGSLSSIAEYTYVLLPTVHVRNRNAGTVYFASKTRNSAKQKKSN